MPQLNNEGGRGEQQLGAEVQGSRRRRHPDGTPTDPGAERRGWSGALRGERKVP